MKSPNPPDKKRGSVILMVIALLTILAMLGSTLVMVARLDRQTSHAIASSAAPAPEVARSVLDMLRADRAADLYIDAAGVIYGNIAGDPQKAIDYPHELVDQVLACIERESNGEWRHVTHMRGAPGGSYVNVKPSELDCDTDGDDANDARLVETGITDPEGRPFLAAVRMIDSSGLLNVNTAYRTSIRNSWPWMPASNISLTPLLANWGNIDTGRSGTAPNIESYDNWYVLRPLAPPPPPVGNARVTPFDLCGDLLGLAWQGNTPSTGTGRLFDILKVADLGARPYLTTWSCSRIVVPLYKSGLATTERLDVRWAVGQAPQPVANNPLYGTFRDMLNCYGPSAGDAKEAAQLLANTIDYTDGADAVTVLEYAPGNYVFGVERQPFITEVFYYKWLNGAVVETKSAIELFNPYSSPIDLKSYEVEGLDSSDFAAGVKIMAPRTYWVIVSDSTLKVADAGKRIEVPFLNLANPVRILRPAPGSPGGKVCVEQFSDNLYAHLADPTVPGAGGAVWLAMQRNDDPKRCLYVLESYTPDLTDAPHNYADTQGSLGAVNDAAASLAGSPCPVYVRNGVFINVGEMARLLRVGPTDTESLPRRLTPLLPEARTLFPGGSASGTPSVQLGCMVGEFFKIDSPLYDGIDNNGVAPADEPTEDIVYGLVNVNTAPKAVLKCLPAIAQDSANVDRIADEIMAYRDQTGGYTNRTGLIPNLRNSPGFGTSGEVAIPIRQAIGAVNGYNANNAPENYAIADGGASDDGLAPFPQDDLDKYNVYYKWLSNQVTVRSDTYIAYILVRSPAGGAGGQRDRRFVALIDRTNCRAAGDLPRVLMMAEIK